MRNEHFEFMMVPFILVKAMTTFVDIIMSMMFMPFLDIFVVVFLDDILLYSMDLVNHRNHLQLVLGKLNEHKMFAKFNKCEFCLKKDKIT